MLRIALYNGGKKLRSALVRVGVGELELTLPGSYFNYTQGVLHMRQFCLPGGNNKEDKQVQSKAQDTELVEKQKQFIEQLKQIRGQSGTRTIEVPILSGWLKQFNDFMYKLAKYKSIGLGISIKRNLETSFDIDDFQQGVLDAYWAMMQLWNDADWEQMKNMCSKQVVDVFKKTCDSYSEHGLQCRVAVENFDDAYIEGMDFLRRQQIIQKYLPELQEEEPTTESNQDDMWFVLITRVRVKTKTTISIIDGGQVQLEQSEERADSLWFARGPIAKELPVDELKCPWILIHIT